MNLNWPHLHGVGGENIGDAAGSHGGGVGTRSNAWVWGMVDGVRMV
jgi:hypothetical protein